MSIRTKKLGLTYFNPTHSNRHKLILKLDSDGYTSKEISEYLNVNGIKPPRTDIYTTKLVWVTIKKLKQRQLKNKEIFVESVSFNSSIIR